MSTGPRLMFVSDEETIGELATAAAASDVEVVSLRPIENSGSLDFELATVVALVTIASKLFFDGALIPAIIAKLKKDPATKIEVSGPNGKIKLEYDADLDPDGVADLIRQTLAV